MPKPPVEDIHSKITTYIFASIASQGEVSYVCLLRPRELAKFFGVSDKTAHRYFKRIGLKKFMDIQDATDAVDAYFGEKHLPDLKLVARRARAIAMHRKAVAQIHLDSVNPAYAVDRAMNALHLQLPRLRRKR